MSVVCVGVVNEGRTSKKQGDHLVCRGCLALLPLAALLLSVVKED